MHRGDRADRAVLRHDVTEIKPKIDEVNTSANCKYLILSTMSTPTMPTTTMSMSGRGCVAWEGVDKDGAEEEGTGKVAWLDPDP